MGGGLEGYENETYNAPASYLCIVDTYISTDCIFQYLFEASISYHSCKYLKSDIQTARGTGTRSGHWYKT